MRAVVQRVSRAKVTVKGEVTGEIGAGLVVLLGVGEQDTEADADYLAVKIAGLRVFEDDAGKMNVSVIESGTAERCWRFRSLRCLAMCAVGGVLRSMGRRGQSVPASSTSISSAAYAPWGCAARPDAFRK